jgi:hypothetical protein
VSTDCRLNGRIQVRMWCSKTVSGHLTSHMESNNRIKQKPECRRATCACGTTEPLGRM